MKLIGENKGFEIYFDIDLQEYFVFKDRKLLIRNKYRYREVKSYLD